MPGASSELAIRAMPREVVQPMKGNMQTDNESIHQAKPTAPAAMVTRRSGVVSCNLNDESVLLDTISGIYFGLNPVGASIWRVIEAPLSAGQIREELQKEYEIDTAACDAAVQEFLSQLSAKGLITLQEK